MQRREFLGKMVGTSLAVLSLDTISKGKDTTFEERARKYLRAIIPSRQRIEDFISGEYGPRDKNPGEIFQYDPELGWVHHEAIGSTGVDRSKVFYNYESDGARKIINFPDKPSRVRTYGNSFTHCSQANNNETWEEYLAAHLQEPIRNYGVGGYGVRAQLGHLRQRSLLVTGIAGDRCDERRDQVVPQLQRDVDLRPRVLAGEPQSDEPVVGKPDEGAEGEDENGDGDQGDQDGRLPVRSRTPRAPRPAAYRA